MLTRFDWTSVLALFSGAILVCFLGTAFGGAEVAVYLLPLSGLFMSVIYPTINSKGISCFPKSEHGAVAGVILFFTCVSAVVAPRGNPTTEHTPTPVPRSRREQVATQVGFTHTVAK